MLGLFGTLDLGARSLQTQQMGVEVAGHNLANVNNPAYARQSLIVQPSDPLPSAVGPQGTGAQVVGIQQMRDALLDRQIQSETSVSGYWNTLQSALQEAQSSLGEAINLQRNATGSTGTDTGAGTVGGLLDSLSGLFQSFSTLATSPASLAERQALLSTAQQLAGQFNTVDQRLASLDRSLDESLTSDVGEANQLLQDITQLNQQISRAEAFNKGSANDLRDLRQQKLEQLAQLVNVDTAVGNNGTVDVSVSGTLLVSGVTQLDSLGTYTDASGNLGVQAASTATPLSLTGGSLAGTIEARDGALAQLRGGLNQIAATLISEVNGIHASGYNLHGGTGALFFEGTGAADIQVNQALVQDPSLLQAAGVPGAAGDNQVALKLADLLNQKEAALQNQTFTDNYNRVVAGLGEAISTAASEIQTQGTVTRMLQAQRDQVGGVSLDEEMASLMQYQRAYQASARLVTAVDQMFDDLMSIR